jgi:hypothetical protein
MRCLETSSVKYKHFAFFRAISQSQIDPAESADTLMRSLRRGAVYRSRNHRPEQAPASPESAIDPMHNRSVECNRRISLSITPFGANRVRLYVSICRFGRIIILQLAGQLAI